MIFTVDMASVIVAPMEGLLKVIWRLSGFSITLSLAMLKFIKSSVLPIGMVKEALTA